jgi:type VI secretion system protein ImpL
MIDRFFSTNLAPLVNLTGKTWAWKPEATAGQKLSESTLHQFQQAADIRDAFFPTGGAVPNVPLEVKMLTLNSGAQTATLEINGSNVVGQSPSTPGAQNQATVVQWPGPGASGASIALAPELPDQKSKLERTGAWALFRLIDAGAVTPHGSAITVGFVVGGRDVSFQFSVSSLNNPLTMPSLRQFKCPNGL